MDCSRFREQIALLVEGDLGERAARRLRGHIDRCADCRAFESGMRDSQAAVHALAQAPVAPALLTATHARIVTEARAVLQTHRPSFPAWQLVFACCVAVVLVGAAALLMRQAGGDLRLSPRPMAAAGGKPVVVVLPPAPPAVPVPEAAVPLPAARRPVFAAAARADDHHQRKSAAPDVAVIKIFTDDPDVIIFLVPDQEGGKKS